MVGEDEATLSGTQRDVGRGNPPIEHRFKPGNQASKGRRNGWHLKPLLKRLMAEVNPNDRKGRTNAQLLVEATMLHAMKGNSTALKEIWDRIEGKLVQEIAGEGGGPVKLIVEYADKKPQDDGTTV